MTVSAFSPCYCLGIVPVLIRPDINALVDWAEKSPNYTFANGLRQDSECSLTSRLSIVPLLLVCGMTVSDFSLCFVLVSFLC